MKTRQRVLIHALDRDGVDLLVAIGLEDALGLGAVGLVPSHVGVDQTRREQDGPVAQLLKLPSPVVR